MAFQTLDRQRPVDSHLKSKRTVWREPENPVRSAFEKLLREKDRTQRTYAVNPYAEVFTFREGVWGIYTHSLDGMGDPWIYLIEGPDSAMLIDTGFGLGDLKGLVRELIGDKPYVVANTHCAFDHSYGNTAFDKVYCHEYEAFNLQARMRPDIWDYLFDAEGRGIWADFDRADLVAFKEYEVVGVPNGTVFSLGGGHEIELIFLPGHSNGHAAFLDRKHRILFAGDDACVGALGVGGGQAGSPWRRFATVEALAVELRRLVARLDEFDWIFPGHGAVEVGPILLASILEACEAVLADPKAYHEKKETERNGVRTMQYRRMIFESGFLQYNAKSLYMDREIDPELV